MLTTDPYVTVDPTPAAPGGRARELADLLIIATPHAEYRDLTTDKPVADVWNLLGNGVLV